MRATARRSGRAASTSRGSRRAAAWSRPTPCSTGASHGVRPRAPARAPRRARDAAAASACSATSRSPPCTCARRAASAGSRWSTGTCITATAPRRPSGAIPDVLTISLHQDGLYPLHSGRARGRGGGARPRREHQHPAARRLRRRGLPRGVRAGRRAGARALRPRARVRRLGARCERASIRSGACSCEATTTARSPTCCSRRSARICGGRLVLCHEGGYSAGLRAVLRRGDHRGAARDRAARGRPVLRGARRASGRAGAAARARGRRGRARAARAVASYT